MYERRMQNPAYACEDEQGRCEVFASRRELLQEAVPRTRTVIFNLEPEQARLCIDKIAVEMNIVVLEQI